MSSGLAAGFLSAQELKDNEDEVKAKRRAKVDQEDDKITGKGAETTYRGKDGKMITRDEWLDTKLKKRKRDDVEEQNLEWGGGIKQKDDREAQDEEVKKIVQEKFARYDIREDVDKELRSVLRPDDPMYKGGFGESAMDRAEQKAKKLRCPFTAPPNRFGIPAGARWDGKVRGTEYEKRFLKRQNEIKHLKTECFTWSIEEM